MQIWEDIHETMKSMDVSWLSADFPSWDLNLELAWQPVVLSCRRETYETSRLSFGQGTDGFVLLPVQFPSAPIIFSNYGSHSWLLLDSWATSLKQDHFKLEQLFCVVP